MSDMDIGVRDLRNDTARVVDVVRGGDRFTLTVNGEPGADIVPHLHCARWLSGEVVRSRLSSLSADPELRRDLDE